jgi:hypothetical protein
MAGSAEESMITRQSALVVEQLTMRTRRARLWERRCDRGSDLQNSLRALARIVARSGVVHPHQTLSEGLGDRSRERLAGHLSEFPRELLGLGVLDVHRQSARLLLRRVRTLLHHSAAALDGAPLGPTPQPAVLSPSGRRTHAANGDDAGAR